MTPVSLDAWCRLEETLLRRFSRKRANEALAVLRKWSGWVWPGERDVLDAVPHLAQQAAARRRRQAAAELPRMRTLPPITSADQLPRLLEQRRFGIPVDIVWPEDRCLSPFHALAIVRLGMPMVLAICRVIGGRLLVPFDDLRAQADQRDEEQDVRLLRLEDERTATDSLRAERGPFVASLV
jgi:hypothetical protein